MKTRIKFALPLTVLLVLLGVAAFVPKLFKSNTQTQPQAQLPKAMTPALPPFKAQTVAFTNVNVLPMNKEQVLKNQTVIVRDGRIVQIGDAGKVKVPKDAQTVDGRGKYLMPGLADMHVHLLPGTANGEDAATVQIKLFLANGITTVRGMIGHPTNIGVRDKVNKGEILGPTLVCSSPPLLGNKIQTPADGEKAVLDQKKAGFDAIKVHEGLSPETYEAIVKTARQEGIPFAGHVTHTVGLKRALAARQQSIEHLDGYFRAMIPDSIQTPPGQFIFGEPLKAVDESKMPALVQETKQAGVWNSPTLALFKTVASDETPEELLKRPELKYVSEKARQQFATQKKMGAGIADAPLAERQRYVELRNKLVKSLSQNGAKLVVGSDSPQFFLVSGFAMHHELKAFVDAGLSPYAVLEAATRNGVEYVGQIKDAGTIEVGKRADLLLLDANPLENIANVQKNSGVMVRGHWLSPTDLQKMLSEVETFVSQQPK